MKDDDNNDYLHPFPRYPRRADHEKAWEELARAIAVTQEHVMRGHGGMAAGRPGPVGELTVIGSGIEAVGFTRNDEKLIQSADKVFYCVADPATVVWLKAMRPDAYDLYVLYDDTKIRYTTYMQMTEAILYYVRQGLKVLAIYYGHPGIFVLSSHRAIKIARREGHVATMRAGISALDTLCADLGVDPSQPGMQTFEATDMLVRARVPDIGLHVVLWQVGLVGELGYRRHGYINSQFSILVEYLQQYYGEDYPVVNYIGSRYPGIAPTNEIYTLKQLHDPDIQAKVTGISTFYLAPREARPADVAMMRRLGMLKPGATPKLNEAALRTIDAYGERERAAFTQFANFQVPKGYHWQEDTAAARFILALADDPKLAGEYVQSPANVSLLGFYGLSDFDRSLLSSKDAGSLQLAAKGRGRQRNTSNTCLLRDIFCSKPLAKSLRQAVRQVRPQILPEVLQNWSETAGYRTDWACMATDFQAIARRQLYPWTGLYLSHEPKVLICLLGNPRQPKRCRVYVNGVLLHKADYEHGRLVWKVAAGNPNNGRVHTDLAPGGKRRLAGTVWSEGDPLPARHNFQAAEIDFQPVELCQFLGEYRIEGGPDTLSIHLQRLPDGEPRLQNLHNGIDADIRIEPGGLNVDGRPIPFAALRPTTPIPDALKAHYTVKAAKDGSRSLHSFDLSEGRLKIDGRAVGGQTESPNKIAWRDGGDPFEKGELNLLLDPVSLLPLCHGSANGGDIKLTGMKPAEEEDKRREQTPSFNLPPWAWKHVLDIAHDASRKGGLFLWHTWDRHRYGSQVLRQAMTKLRVE